MIEMPIPAGTVIPAVQVQVPAGILIVSPSAAVCVGPLITAFTSLWLQLAAVNVVGPLMVKENAIGPAVPPAFITVTLRLEVPAVVGVPLSTPAEESIIPAGTPVAIQVKGAVPVAVN
jgi:hypothetical protein